MEREVHRRPVAPVAVREVSVLQYSMLAPKRVRARMYEKTGVGGVDGPWTCCQRCQN